jgi:hypothetical protein
VTAYRLDIEITLDYPTPKVGSKNDWLLFYHSDGHLEVMSNADFIRDWTPVDQEARQYLG